MEEDRWIPAQVSSSMLLTATCGILAPVVIPYVQFGLIYSHWTPYKRPVNRDSCSCTCWDTIFKGSYQELGQGYKHVYFNITSNTLVIWLVTVCAVVAVYETTKYLIRLIVARQIRLPMFILFISSFYSHYYTWWSLFNACNDEFYSQFLHQALFSMTEVASSLMVLWLCDARRPLTLRPLLVILSVSVFHVLASSSDQFMENVLWKSGSWHQVVRDLGFMLDDLIHLFVSAVYVRSYLKSHGQPLSMLISRDEIVLIIILIFILWFFCVLF